jgi:hypothetical protein
MWVFGEPGARVREGALLKILKADVMCPIAAFGAHFARRGQSRVLKGDERFDLGRARQAESLRALHDDGVDAVAGRKGIAHLI